MLSDQQVLSVPDSHELRRDLQAATDGAGIIGTLQLQMPSQFGPIDSVSTTRIITTNQETFIAQLTVTALRDSPIDRAHLLMRVVPDETADSFPGGRHDTPPVTGAATDGG